MAPNGTDSLNWGDFKMGVITYYSTQAFLPENFLCANQSCWSDTLARIVVQENDTQSHNLTR